MVHTKEAARRQRFANRHFRMLVLCGVIPGAPNGVPHSGVRFEHRRYYRYGYLGLDTTTHLGHKEWITVYGGRCITSVASQRPRIVRPRFHCGALFNSPIF